MKYILFTCILLTCMYAANSQGKWTQKKDFGGVQRAGAVGFSIGTNGYIGTGSNGHDITYSDFTDEFWEYDASADTWTQKANFAGGPIAYAVGFSIGNKGYIGTGLYVNTYVSSFWEYNPSTNAWTQKANLAGAARSKAVGFSMGDKGYIGTGINDPDINRPALSDFWEYDPATDSWTRKADFPGGARYGATGFSVGNKGFIGTGHISTAFSHTLSNDIWAYDPDTNKWKQMANVGGGVRENAVGFSINDMGYVGTGNNGDSCLKDFWEYNMVTGGWTLRANFSGITRQKAVAFSIYDSAYIGTGVDFYSINGYNDFWEYRPTLNLISTNTITGSPFCAGSSVNVPFTTRGIANAGNIFTAQLSNSVGSFANPVNIGTLSSTTSGTVSAEIPSNTPSGNAYRIRVVSSNPAVTGFDNASNITIVALTLFYRDADFDGFGDPNSSPLLGCNAPFGYVANNLDCDDTKTYVHPGAQEICGDGIDDNCDGQIDEGCSICANGTNLTTTNITSSSATLKWTAPVDPAKWQIKYKEVGAASWTKLNRGGSARSVKISSLNADKSYKWCIRAECGTTWTAYSDTIQFKTLTTQQLMGIEQSDVSNYLNTENISALNLYPNPTNGQFVLDLHLSNNSNTNARIELVNMLGKIVHRETVTISNSVLQKNISIPPSLTSGIYLVRIIVNNRIYQGKLIYQK